MGLTAQDGKPVCYELDEKLQMVDQLRIRSKDNQLIHHGWTWKFRNDQCQYSRTPLLNKNLGN